MNCIYIFLADGFEEVEGLTSVDLLRRAGLSVKTVSVMESTAICGSHGIRLTADMHITGLSPEQISPDDMLVLPGGLPGTDHLEDHETLRTLLLAQQKAGGHLAAICAAPRIFAHLGFLKDKNATSYPGCVSPDECLTYLEQPVVIDGNIITSRGVGTAIPFALAIIETMLGKEAADRIADSILFKRQIIK